MRSILIPAILFSTTGLALAAAWAHKNIDNNAGAYTATKAKSVAPLPPDVFTSMSYFPKRGGSTDWGLALSGGGIRSAAFSIGAMKALYDLKLLRDIDVISSVSGGGYASYWLFSKFHQANPATGEFGDSAFADSLFVKNVCLLETTANFVPNRTMLRAFFNTKAGAFKIYKESITRSFGNGLDPSTSLTYLNSAISQGRAPYFIINTTRGKKENDREVFELAPEYMGSRTWGTLTWNETSAAPLPLNESVTISAAALGKLGRNVTAYASPAAAGAPFLWDGGRAENLAAFGLITRGMPNVIIVDGEQDSKYIFEGYGILKRRLGAAGIALSVPDIDGFLDKRPAKPVLPFTGLSVCVGNATATTTGKRTTIYYIKMSIPNDVKRQLDDEAITKAHTGRGWLVNNTINKEYMKTHNCACYDHYPAIPKGQQQQAEMYAAITGNYARFLNSKWKWRLSNYQFPHVPTSDQSFYTDQLDAFIGLGYLEALSMSNHVGTR